MYIQETTAEERLIIERTVNDLFVSFERANRLLLIAQERFFGDFEQKEIGEGEAEEISDILYMVTDVMHNALLEYALIVGHYDFCGVRSHLRGAKTAQQTAQIEELLRKIKDAEKRKQIMSMPDSEALIVLRELTKEV